MFRVMDTENNHLTPDVGTLSLQYTQQVRSVNNQWEKDRVDTPFGPCTNEHMVPQALSIISEELDFSQFFCPYDKNLTLGGNYYAPFFDYLRLEVKMCENETLGCKNEGWVFFMEPSLSKITNDSIELLLVVTSTRPLYM